MERSDFLERKRIIEGKLTILKEIEPRYFDFIIKWRNDKALNVYINQPFVLTLEKQMKWYENYYLNDNSQMLYVMIDKEKDIPFGTMGYVSYDEIKNICISARLMAGDIRYQGSPYLMEGLLLFFDYLYYGMGIETVYSHVVCDNVSSLRLQKRLGLVKNEGKIYFPERLHDSNLPMVEIIGNLERYELGKSKILKLLEGIL